jgi:hypothetical protein
MLILRASTPVVTGRATLRQRTPIFDSPAAVAGLLLRRTSHDGRTAGLETGGLEGEAVDAATSAGDDSHRSWMQQSGDVVASAGARSFRAPRRAPSGCRFRRRSVCLVGSDSSADPTVLKRSSPNVRTQRSKLRSSATEGASRPPPTRVASEVRAARSARAGELASVLLTVRRVRSSPRTLRPLMSS